VPQKRVSVRAIRERARRARGTPRSIKRGARVRYNRADLIAITLEGPVLEDLPSGVPFRWNYRDCRSIAVADEWRTAENRAARLVHDGEDSDNAGHFRKSGRAAGLTLLPIKVSHAGSINGVFRNVFRDRTRATLQSTFATHLAGTWPWARGRSASRLIKANNMDLLISLLRRPAVITVLRVPRYLLELASSRD